MSKSIDIASSAVSGKCELKCSYNFNYVESATTVENKGVVLYFSYDTSIPPVTYNGQKYTVDKIMIACPSVHLFNGAKTDAECIIQHTPQTGGQLMNVGIPMVQSTSTTPASDVISQLIADTSTYAPNEGSSSTIPGGLNLQQIVPTTPFFSYQTKETDWIVYDVANAIPLTSDTLQTLSTIIQPYQLPTPYAKLFYNSIGPNSVTVNTEGIYISCKPTGTSDTTTEVSYKKKISNALLSKTVQMVLLVLGWIIWSVLVGYTFNTAYEKIIGNVPGGEVMDRSFMMAIAAVVLLLGGLITATVFYSKK